MAAAIAQAKHPSGFNGFNISKDVSFYFDYMDSGQRIDEDDIRCAGR
jgi:hypothetical protein